MKFDQRFGGTALSDNEWQFDLKEEWNGGFGGTTGGVSTTTCLEGNNISPESSHSAVSGNGLSEAVVEER